MRMWIRQVLDSEPLFADFIAWTEEIERNLSEKMQIAARTGKLEEVQAIALEMGVYSKMRKSFQAEKREAAALAAFDNSKPN